MFQKASTWVSQMVGTPFAFMLAAVTIILWAISGPFLHFSEVWQLTINTATTIITFLMVFLIQSSQNNDTAAIHAKLNEILFAIDKADNRFIGIEQQPHEEVQRLSRTIEKVVSDDCERRP